MAKSHVGDVTQASMRLARLVLDDLDPGYWTYLRRFKANKSPEAVRALAKAPQQFLALLDRCASLTDTSVRPAATKTALTRATRSLHAIYVPVQRRGVEVPEWELLEALRELIYTIGDPDLNSLIEQAHRLRLFVARHAAADVDTALFGDEFLGALYRTLAYIDHAKSLHDAWHTVWLVSD